MTDFIPPFSTRLTNRQVILTPIEKTQTVQLQKALHAARGLPPGGQPCRC